MRPHRLHYIRREALAIGFIGVEQREAGIEAAAGYREALEFLVKDYVSREPFEALDKAKEDGDQSAAEKAERRLRAIKETRLGSVIENYIPDERIKETARRAAWLGNDATHYIRRWENHDLGDLKDLIGLVLGFIVSEESYKEMLRRMPST